jgi:hypothetical protein
MRIAVSKLDLFDRTSNPCDLSEKYFSLARQPIAQLLCSGLHLLHNKRIFLAINLLTLAMPNAVATSGAMSKLILVLTDLARNARWTH